MQTNSSIEATELQGVSTGFAREVLSALDATFAITEGSNCCAIPPMESNLPKIPPNSSAQNKSRVSAKFKKRWVEMERQIVLQRMQHLLSPTGFLPQGPPVMVDQILGSKPDKSSSTKFMICR